MKAALDTEKILERVREKRLQESGHEENLEESAEQIKKLLEKGMKKGRYVELEEINANLNYIASILAYTEFEKRFVEKVIQKRKTFKNSRSFESHMEQIRMKMRFLEKFERYISKRCPKREKGKGKTADFEQNEKISGMVYRSGHLGSWCIF